MKLRTLTPLQLITNIVLFAVRCLTQSSSPKTFIIIIANIRANIQTSAIKKRANKKNSLKRSLCFVSTMLTKKHSNTKCDKMSKKAKNIKKLP